MTSNTLQDWQPAQSPSAQALQGHYVRLELLSPTRHGDDLWLALQGPEADPQMWQFMAYGPFVSRDDFEQWLSSNAASRDPLFYAVVDRASGKALGLLSYLSVVPQHGSIEIGHVCFGHALQRSVQATETIYLLARYAFELGNRRLEWKCDNANLRSKRAAARFGFSYEGLFRQHQVRKGRNSDTAWFSLLDHEWPTRQRGFEQWLTAENFDAQGQQRQSLTALRAG